MGNNKSIKCSFRVRSFFLDLKKPWATIIIVVTFLMFFLNLYDLIAKGMGYSLKGIGLIGFIGCSLFMLAESLVHKVNVFDDDSIAVTSLFFLGRKEFSKESILGFHSKKGLLLKKKKKRILYYPKVEYYPKKECSDWINESFDKLDNP